jgi:predicted ATP-dependent serine protease
MTREIDCPNCGKPNEYSLGSCRGCGLEREIFDKIKHAKEASSELNKSKIAKTDTWRHLLA